MLQGARILIVDDERTTRLSLSEIFSLRGANTTTAADGSEALAQIQQTAFDLIILDIQMPDGSGIDLLDTIKAERALTRVVMLTNYPLPQLRKRCLDAGAECFLDKCGDVEEIREILRRITATIGGRTI